jgi:hypothetical protein
VLSLTPSLVQVGCAVQSLYRAYTVLVLYRGYTYTVLVQVECAVLYTIHHTPYSLSTAHHIHHTPYSPYSPYTIHRTPLTPYSPYTKHRTPLTPYTIRHTRIHLIIIIIIIIIIIRIISHRRVHARPGCGGHQHGQEGDHGGDEVVGSVHVHCCWRRYCAHAVLMLCGGISTCILLLEEVSTV